MTAKILFGLVVSLLLLTGTVQAQQVPMQCVTTVAAGGTGDAIQLPQLPCWPTTTMVVLQINAPNLTSTPTISVNGSTPIRVVNFDGTPLTPDVFLPGQYRILTYNGSNWLVMTAGAENGLPYSGIVNIMGSPYNAKCDGTTDDSAAINAAKTAAGAIGAAVQFPNGKICFSASGITFGATRVQGASSLVPSNPPSGSELLCPASIAAPCATFGNSGATALGGSVSDLIVGYTGTPVAGDEAIVFQGFGSIWSDILAFNAWDGVTWKNGLGSTGTLLYTWDIYHNHLVEGTYNGGAGTGFAEVTILGARLGMNGAGDQATSNSFVAFTGYDPNSFSCNNCHMNLGSLSPAHMVDFTQITNETNGWYSFNGGGVTDMSIGACSSFIHTDSTAFVYRLTISDEFLLGAGCQLLDQTTQKIGPVELKIHHSIIGGAVNLTTCNAGSDAFDIDHSQLAYETTLNTACITGTYAKFDHNEVDGLFTLESNSSYPWTRLSIQGNSFPGGYVDTAHGTICGDTPNIGWTPVVDIAGSPATGSGYTFANASGFAFRNPDCSVTERWGITITGKGSGTGGFTITGAPYTSTTEGNGSPFMALVNMSGGTGLSGLQVSSQVFASLSTIALNIPGAGGTAAFSDTYIPSTPTVTLTAVNKFVPQ